MKKPLPELASDHDAERFVANANLTDYDLSGMRVMRFEFERRSEPMNIRQIDPSQKNKADQS